MRIKVPDAMAKASFARDKVKPMTPTRRNPPTNKNVSARNIHVN